MNEIERRLEVPNLLLKLDMEKAYDRVMLRAFEFQENAVDLIFCLMGKQQVSFDHPMGFSRGILFSRSCLCW